MLLSTNHYITGKTEIGPLLTEIFSTSSRNKNTPSGADFSWLNGFRNTHVQVAGSNYRQVAQPNPRPVRGQSPKFSSKV